MKFLICKLYVMYLRDPYSNTAHLKNAMIELPKLTARKTILDMHMNLASKILSLIEARKIDKFIKALDNPNRVLNFYINF